MVFILPDIDAGVLTRQREAGVAHALAQAARSPFYRSRAERGVALPTTAGELLAYPCTTKDDLRRAYPFGLLAVDRSELATYHESSGTSGSPTSSYYTEPDWDDLCERFGRKWVGIDSRDTFLVRTPYALMITGHLAHVTARRAGATIVPGDNRSLAMPYRRVVRVLRDLDVTLTWSLPTEPLIWAAAARVAGLDPRTDFPHLRALLVGGEPLSAARRRRIGEIWGVAVVEEYGSTETGSLAGACPEGALHLWADRALFEVRDPVTGAITPSGRGQLVVTPFQREAMPLLRYNLADEVEISDALCPCGSSLPMVTVAGRSGFAYPVGRARVTQARIEELVYSLPIELGVLFWRGRVTASGLELQVEAEMQHAAAAEEALRQGLRAEYGPLAMTVRAVPPGTLLARRLLVGEADVVKPRGLFGPGEDWNTALRYW
jgi:phenylacetate-CoA ligase